MTKTRRRPQPSSHSAAHRTLHRRICGCMIKKKSAVRSTSLTTPSTVVLQQKNKTAEVAPRNAHCRRMWRIRQQSPPEARKAGQGHCAIFRWQGLDGREGHCHSAPAETDVRELHSRLAFGNGRTGHSKRNMPPPKGHKVSRGTMSQGSHRAANSSSLSARRIAMEASWTRSCAVRQGWI